MLSGKRIAFDVDFRNYRLASPGIDFYGVRKLMRTTARVLVFCLLALAGLVCGCVDDPHPRLRVGTFTWPGYEPFFLARSLGYYDEASIQLVEYPAAAEAILAYKHRAIDAATVTLDEFARLAADGHDACIVLMIDYSHGSDVILAREGIADLAALKGRRIGVEAQSLGGFVLSRALEIAGIEMSEVQVVAQRQDELEQAIQQGKLDAVVTYEPYSTRIAAAGARRIFDSSQIPGEIADVLITRRALAERPSAPMVHLAAGWFRALAYLDSQRSDAAARIAPRHRISPAEFLETLDGIRFVSLEENRKLLSGEDTALPRHLQTIAQYLTGAGAIAQPPPLENARSARLIQSLGP